MQPTTSLGSVSLPGCDWVPASLCGNCDAHYPKFLFCCGKFAKTGKKKKKGVLVSRFVVEKPDNEVSSHLPQQEEVPIPDSFPFAEKQIFTTYPLKLNLFQRDVTFV
jgi:hypothetical protein